MRLYFRQTMVIAALTVVAVGGSGFGAGADITGDGKTNLADFNALADVWLAGQSVAPAAGLAGPDTTSYVTMVAGSASTSAAIAVDTSDAFSNECAVFLQGKIAEMTGITLDIWHYTWPTIPSKKIIVGPTAAARWGVVIDQDYPGIENHVVKLVSSRLTLAGNDAGNFRGTMHAVLRFLDMQGFRKYRFDDDDYEIVPTVSEIKVAPVDIDEGPAFDFRSLPAACTPCVQRQIWMDWLRLGGLKVNMGHNEFIPTSECGTHPDYFSWNGSAWIPCDGSGEWQYNTSNPGVIQYACDKAAAFYQADDNWISYSLGPRDTGGYSMDAASVALVAPYNNKYSARFALFGNACQAEMAADYPQYADRYFVFYAYWYTKYAPYPGLTMTDKVVPFVIADGGHAHLFEDDENAVMRAALQNWIDITTGPIGIYEWYIPGYPWNVHEAWDPFPWIAIRKPVLDLRYWRDHGVDWMNYEVAPPSRSDLVPYRWVTYYMAARGMWDPDQNPLALLEQLCRDLYGSGWKAMYDYYNLLDMTMLNSPLNVGTWGLPAPADIYTADIKAQADALLTQAQSDTASDPAVVQGRVQDAVDAWSTGWTNLGL